MGVGAVAWPSVQARRARAARDHGALRLKRHTKLGGKAQSEGAGKRGGRGVGGGGGGGGRHTFDDVRVVKLLKHRNLSQQKVLLFLGPNSREVDELARVVDFGLAVLQIVDVGGRALPELFHRRFAGVRHAVVNLADVFCRLCHVVVHKDAGHFSWPVALIFLDR